MNLTLNSGSFKEPFLCLKNFRMAVSSMFRVLFHHFTSYYRLIQHCDTFFSFTIDHRTEPIL